MSPFDILETRLRINSMFGTIGLRVYRNTTHSISPIKVGVWDCVNPKYSFWKLKRRINSVFVVIGLRVFENTTQGISTI